MKNKKAIMPLIKNQRIKRSNIFLVSTVLCTSLLYWHSFALAVNTNSPSKNTQQNSGQITNAQEIKKSQTGFIESRNSISLHGDSWSVDAYYPSIGVVLVDSNIASWIKHQVSIFEQGLKEMPRQDPSFFSLSIDYQKFLPSLRCASFVFNIKTNTGREIPDQGFRTFTYHVQEGRLLYFEDIFAQPDELINFLSTYSRRVLRFRNWRNPEGLFIENGTSPNEVNFRCFAINKTGLTIFFPPNQLAPAYEGASEVSIPLSDLMQFGPQLSLWGIETVSEEE